MNACIQEGGREESLFRFCSAFPNVNTSMIYRYILDLVESSGLVSCQNEMKYMCNDKMAFLAEILLLALLIDLTIFTLEECSSSSQAKV